MRAKGALGALRARLEGIVERGIAAAMPGLIRRALRRELGAVWGRGDGAALPAGGTLLAANHHSWWDGYLGWLLRERLGRPLSVMMATEQLERFRFFRRLGAIGHRQPREALRRLAAGELVLLFPEGRLRQAGTVGALEPGLAWLARRAAVPIVPLALRVVMRGGEHPEAFVVLGDALPAGGDAEAVSAALRRTLDALLRDIDRIVLETDPEAEPPGFERWLSGRAGAHRRAAWVERVWARR